VDILLFSRVFDTSQEGSWILSTGWVHHCGQTYGGEIEEAP